MPEICRFHGIRITMYYNEHGVPHFHARFAGAKASIAFGGEVLAGSLPTNALNLVREWAQIHAAELDALWHLAAEGRPLPNIEPL